METCLAHQTDELVEVKRGRWRAGHAGLDLRDTHRKTMSIKSVSLQNKKELVIFLLLLSGASFAWFNGWFINILV